MSAIGLQISLLRRAGSAAFEAQQSYIRTIKRLAAFLGRSPDTASFEDVRRFQMHLAANGAHIG
jgi:Phage integrase, N-terminal SAM-like domain